MSTNNAETVATPEQVRAMLEEQRELTQIRDKLRELVDQGDRELAAAKRELSELGKMLIEEFPEDADFVRSLGILQDEQGEPDAE